ncbi:hypothetical protein BDP81DRAFT_450094 [Colletotrichum phormii]|uniref:PRISE-like Rossmann-fold domain-containing protein n=1 Tax=Colletotrichum phormii TaxID=359342 RepID=A0AAJ0EEL8_9PEZI|nr:uncharacterized protein BDP81DRAFT_450094 [Colletotrichum phormii]KAK1636159.1 hypothetical protein BDP81DRAFT_450094 [Colletotrichum phormii]
MAHALILGASGISGWSLLNQARTYPTPTTFVRITGTTNRALTLEEARLPTDDPRLAIVSGIDFTRGVDDVAAVMRETIPDKETVSHVSYTERVGGFVLASEFSNSVGGMMQPTRAPTVPRTKPQQPTTRSPAWSSGLKARATCVRRPGVP